jgi:hypothetical protein
MLLIYKSVLFFQIDWYILSKNTHLTQFFILIKKELSDKKNFFMKHEFYLIKI